MFLIKHIVYIFRCIFSTAYELWFKQIIYEIDSIREIFMGSEKLQQFSLMSLNTSRKDSLEEKPASSVDERVMLDINKRLYMRDC